MDGHIGGYGGWHSEITPEDEAVYWLLRIRELQEEPYNLTTAEAIQRANEEEDSQ